MNTDERYIRRCIELAQKGLGNVQPNPMVGAVIVYNGQIIGEGYHQKYGEPHAEVNAINNVADKSLLRQSTIYVSLEPCSHYGKTPPCADKLIEVGIPRVVIGSTDPNEKVNGKGIAKLRAAGTDVTVGVLKEECDELNKRFFTYHLRRRPYVILKWAQTADGYMDIDRTANPDGKYWITNDKVKVLTHRWRSDEQAILIGYKTYLNDRPQLTTRLWPGKSPARYIACRNPESAEPVEGFTLVSEEPEAALQRLYDDKMQSVIIEGGRKTLDRFIASGLWDEARILTGDQTWGAGMEAPKLTGGECVKNYDLDNNHVEIRRNKIM
ncbi:MAG: bifunctional diaminohydroxyphosphoribosylaminopyrimidine deaminase/5-amino-6-(5-phosphoribosylamino)uracil reductase RibD [Bacteroidales bacterium]|nr:bifunctional diaminohydroxyphosphoribosylaminopyrimidine deaminase/5-amino-6-(5-phosphoribosylamino)uracil reductase RibD [Bacteroidales bacterium]